MLKITMSDNVLMIGPPGSRKTMLAQRFSIILLPVGLGWTS